MTLKLADLQTVQEQPACTLTFSFMSSGQRQDVVLTAESMMLPSEMAAALDSLLTKHLLSQVSR
jgi:hypothetical protein